MDNSIYIQREVDARAKDEADARAILDAASDEKRDLSDEENERFERFVTSSEVRKSRDRKSTRLNSSHIQKSRMPSSA